MTDEPKKFRPRHRLISAGGFLRMAAAIGVFFLICHVLGWRENTAYLSGSAPDGERGALSLGLGALYLAAYVSFVVIAPILALAAAFFSLLGRVVRRAPAQSSA